MRRIATLLALTAFATANLAQAATPPCLTSAEFTALSSYALPSAISGMAQRCSTSLPAGAFMKTDGNRLAARYAARKAAAWTAAKPAVLKLAAAENPQLIEVLRGTPDAALQPLADSFISSMVVQKLPENRCSALDRLLRLLAPLPPENTAELIALAAGLAAQDGRAKVGQIQICSAS